MLTTRAHIVKEILETEASYVRNLTDFSTLYLGRLVGSSEQESVQADFQSRNSLVCVCHNMDQILVLSRHLHSELTKSVSASAELLREEMKASLNDSTLEINEDATFQQRSLSCARLGSVFKRTAALMRLYGQFAENHSEAQMDVMDMVSNSSFDKLWKRIHLESLNSNQAGVPIAVESLDGYLILPIQRVPRYVLLLRELLKNTPEDWTLEVENLKSGLESVSSVARYIDDCILKSTQMKELKMLEDKFLPKNSVNLLDGVEHRWLIKSGKVKDVRARKTVTLHLFNDLLLKSVCSSKDNLKLKKALVLNADATVETDDAAFSTAATPELAPQQQQQQQQQQQRLQRLSSMTSLTTISTTDRKFSVCVDGQTTETFAAESEAEMRAWADAVRECCSKASLNASSSPLTKRSLLKRRKSSFTNNEFRCGNCDKKLSSKSAKTCGKCGETLCSSCLVSKKPASSSWASRTISVCESCRFLQDECRLDEKPHEFRLSIEFLQLQTLVSTPVLNKFALLDSDSPDAREARSRVYWVSDDPAAKGPCDFAYAHNACLTCPISDEKLILRMILHGVGDIGFVELNLNDLLESDSVRRGHLFKKWFRIKNLIDVDESKRNLVALASCFVADGVYSSLSAKEVDSLGVGVELKLTLQTPPSLWNLHFDVPVEDALHLKRIRETDFSVGGSRALTDAKLNVSLLKEYERAAVATNNKQKKYLLALTNALYADALAYFGSRKESAFADTQLSLLNRLRSFHESLNDESVDSSPMVILDANEDSGDSGDFCDSSSDCSDSLETLEEFINDFLKEEREYVSKLEALDNVFVSRLMRIARGADPSSFLSPGRQLKNDFTSRNGLMPLDVGVSDSLFKRRQRSYENAAGNNLESLDAKDRAQIDLFLSKSSTTVMLQAITQLRTIHNEFLSQLEVCNDNEFDFDVVVDAIEQKLSSVLQTYDAYTAQHPFVSDALTARRAHAHAAAADDGLALLIKACERETPSSLVSLLKSPLDRLEAYRVSMSTMLVLTDEDSPSWVKLRDALGSVVERLRLAKTAKRRKLNQNALSHVEKKVNNIPCTLTHPTRWLVREGFLVSRTSKRDRTNHFWLFSDCLVYATAERFSSADETTSEAVVAARGAATGRPPFRFEGMVHFTSENFVSISDLPNGLPRRGKKGSDVSLVGDTANAFAVSTGDKAALILMIPLDPTDCYTRKGPGASFIPANKSVKPTTYERAEVKSAWLADLAAVLSARTKNVDFDDEGFWNTQ